jgi:hypothetical protein
MSPFTTCEKGHDLTEEGAFMYRTNGARECRKCAYPNSKLSRSGRSAF